jgi:hypothetical protein
MIEYGTVWINFGNGSLKKKNTRIPRDRLDTDLYRGWKGS